MIEWKRRREVFLYLPPLPLNMNFSRSSLSSPIPNSSFGLKGLRAACPSPCAAHHPFSTPAALQAAAAADDAVEGRGGGAGEGGGGEGGRGGQVVTGSGVQGMTGGGMQVR